MDVLLDELVVALESVELGMLVADEPVPMLLSVAEDVGLVASVPGVIVLVPVDEPIDDEPMDEDPEGMVDMVLP